MPAMPPPLEPLFGDLRALARGIVGGVLEGRDGKSESEKAVPRGDFMAGRGWGPDISEGPQQRRMPVGCSNGIPRGPLPEGRWAFGHQAGRGVELGRGRHDMGRALRAVGEWRGPSALRAQRGPGRNRGT